MRLFDEIGADIRSILNGVALRPLRVPGSDNLRPHGFRRLIEWHSRRKRCRL